MFLCIVKQLKFIEYIKKNYLVPQSTNQELTYGVLTDVSKSLNNILGDSSGRTVSRRTTQGFKSLLNFNDISDENAEHIVHGSMILTLALISSKDKNSKSWGVIILVLLIIFYWLGKHTCQPAYLAYGNSTNKLIY